MQNQRTNSMPDENSFKELHGQEKQEAKVEIEWDITDFWPDCPGHEIENYEDKNGR